MKKVKIQIRTKVDRERNILTNVLVDGYQLNKTMHVRKDGKVWVTHCAKCGFELTRGHKKRSDVLTDLAKLDPQKPTHKALKDKCRNHLLACHPQLRPTPPAAPKTEKRKKITMYHLVGDRANKSINDAVLKYTVKDKNLTIEVRQTECRAFIYTAKGTYKLKRDDANRKYRFVGGGRDMQLEHLTWTGTLKVSQ